MADLKISQLSSATALAGTEVVPVVQGGSTKKATIDQILAPASGKGINFSAAGGDTLTMYDEGTWTPTVVGTSTAGTATYGLQSGTYTRIGRMVYFQCELVWSGGTGTGNLRIAGLPFTCGANNCAVSVGDIENVALTALFYVAGAYVAASSTQVVLRECAVGGGANNPVAYDAAGTLRIGGCYYV